MTYFFENERVRMFDEQAVGFAVWFDAPEAADMKQLWAFAEQLHADHPQGYSYINLVVSGTPSFSSEVRSEAARIVKETSGWGYATCHVILLGGLRGTAVRSFLSTTVLLGRPKTPTKVTSDVEEGVDFVLGHMGADAPDRATVLAAAHQSMERANRGGGRF